MSIALEDRYWTGQKEWQDFREEEESKKANRTTRTELDDELKFCPVEKREEKITEAFKKRMEDLRKSRILFVKEGENGLEYAVIRQKNRFMKSNYKNLRRRYQKLFTGQYAEGVFLTLTTWDKKFQSKEQALVRIWSDFHQFKKQLDKYKRVRLFVDQRKFYKPMEYLACLEFSKRGWPHLHICFVGVKYLAPKGYLKKLWYRYHQSYLIKVVGIRGVSVYGYIMKYFDKFRDLPVKLQAFMWYGRKRFYNTSRRFYNEVKKKVESGYVFIACIKGYFTEELPGIFELLKFTGATLEDAKESFNKILS